MKPYLAGGLLAAMGLGCGGAPEVKGPAPLRPSSLHLRPLTDLAPAAGLVWLVDARPREVASHSELLPSIEELATPARMRGFTERHGGLDPLAVEELVVAGYHEATLWMALTPLDPSRVERAFAGRAVHLDGRAVDWGAGQPLDTILRTWGTVETDREQLAIFGHEAVGVETGRFATLRVAELFSESRLRKASPALRASPLREASALLPDAPLRAFAPGPFSGHMALGLGGLLGGATSASGSARFVESDETDGGRQSISVALTFVLTGAWGADADAARERLLAAFGVLADSGIGRLLGLSRPVAPVSAVATADALTLDVTLDAGTLARGLRDATSAAVEDILRR